MLEDLNLTRSFFWAAAAVFTMFWLILNLKLGFRHAVVTKEYPARASPTNVQGQREFPPLHPWSRASDVWERPPARERRSTQRHPRDAWGRYQYI